ncbi:MAG: DnaD domain protein [Ruminococcus sp.]|nr:DnaD domain protein [Oscillospiraceae bacterium]
MDFRTNSGIWGAMFGVPSIIADNLLKLATGEQLKVLLYLLRHSGRSCSDSEISANTGVPLNQISDALMFWQQVNVLNSDSNSIMTPQPEQQNIMNTQPEPPVENQIPRRQRQNLTPSEITKLMSDSSDVAELFKTAESLLGTLNHTQQNSLIWMYSYLGLKKEVIITLLSYCISIEKTNPGYIEKIAGSWAENEINTLPDAISEVERLTESRSYTAKIMSAFDMKHRPTTKQQAVIDGWKAENYPLELIRYAYEITIETIDKLSFPYISRILESWKQDGLMTIDDVKASKLEYKKKKSSGAEQDEFDVDKYKKFVNNF